MYIQKEITINAVIHAKEDNPLFCAKYCAFRDEIQCLLFSNMLSCEKIGSTQKTAIKRCQSCIEHFGTGEE